MTVKEMISFLEKLPPDHIVGICYDTFDRELDWDQVGVSNQRCVLDDDFDMYDDWAKHVVRSDYGTDSFDDRENRYTDHQSSIFICPPVSDCESGGGE